MAITTFQSVVRSAGGDTKKVVSPGSMVMMAPFRIDDPTAANTTAVQRTASNTAEVILPVGAIVLQIQVSAGATGGTNPTFDLGWVGYSDSSQTDVDGLIAEGDADAGSTIFNFATATAGADLGSVMSSTQAVKIIGGVGASVPTGGSIAGIIMYAVQDDGVWE